MLSRAAQEMRRKLYVYYCWLYFALGVCSLGGGIYLGIVALRSRDSGPGNPLGFMVAISLTLVIFGLLRGGLALYNLRRLYGPRRRRLKVPED